MEKPPLTGDDLTGVSSNAAVQQELESKFVQKVSLDNSKNCLQYFKQLEEKPNTILLFRTCSDSVPTRKLVQSPTAPVLLSREHAGIPYAAQIGNSKLYTEESFNTDHDKYDKDRCLNRLNPQKVPSLIISQNCKCNVKFTRLRKPVVNHSTGKKIFGHKSNLDYLVPEEEETTTLLLIFTFGATRVFLENTFGYIHERFQGRSYALWGSETFYPIIANDSKRRKKRPAVDEPMGFVGISISSPNMNVFSRVLSCKNMNISGFCQNLLRFKSTVVLGHHSIAFINGPSYDGINSDQDYEKEYLYNFKKVFPNVPFISTFHNRKYRSFGCDITGPNRFLMHFDSISIVIITFN